MPINALFQTGHLRADDKWILQEFLENSNQKNNFNYSYATPRGSPLYANFCKQPGGVLYLLLDTVYVIREDEMA